jgi:ABC-type cobalamin/Fe3+-siderophores transport system ATPase subunit
METLSLEVNGLSVRRGGRFLVKDVVLAVHPSELVIILGPNGAGKTTLLRAIRGERPHSGKVYLNRHDLYAAPEWWLKHIGQVPSHNVLHENLTLRQALMYKTQLTIQIFLQPRANSGLRLCSVNSSYLRAFGILWSAGLATGSASWLTSVLSFWESHRF